MKYGVKITKAFKKDLKKAEKQGKNLDLLWGIVDKLANAEPLRGKAPRPPA